MCFTLLSVKYGGIFLLVVFAVSAFGQESFSARDVLRKMTAAADAAIPYSVQFDQKTTLNPLKTTAYQQRSSTGHFQLRTDMLQALPGKEYDLTAWENEAGQWAQVGPSILRLDFEPRSQQSPLMAFLGALTDDKYDDIRVEKEIRFQETQCYVIRARLSAQFMQEDTRS